MDYDNESLKLQPLFDIWNIGFFTLSAKYLIFFHIIRFFPILCKFILSRNYLVRKLILIQYFELFRDLNFLNNTKSPKKLILTDNKKMLTLTKNAFSKSNGSADDSKKMILKDEWLGLGHSSGRVREEKWNWNLSFLKFDLFWPWLTSKLDH